ncbi:hypothetical protein F4802DRAFT_564412 [Xylaria palmicola]|nr:hypothetical protein F4802DRAFT_564412 [Xylaria palmicola]
MVRHVGGSAYIQALLITLLIRSNTAWALSWRGRAITQPDEAEEQPLMPASGNSASHLLRLTTRPPTSYELALDELQQLESEPLCHRTAARLLVHNCQLLEGKDEATVLTDSGHKIRDFVDSYAASLAICDLERGRFAIPPECSKFQEGILSRLQIQNAARLHVTSAEIDCCLSGLGASDSAWNTWVSYRHKALRFCEAARAENDKAQNIALFQRLTKIMNRLADDVEANWEHQMENLDNYAKAMGEKVEALLPLLKRLHQDLEHANDITYHHLLQGLEQSQDQMNSTLGIAAHLERMMQVIFKDFMDGHAEAAAVHDKSMQLLSQRATSEMDIVASAMAATALAATAALENHIEKTRIQATELEYKQDVLEKGMQRLINVSDTLASKYDMHTDLLEQAQNITNEILRVLNDTSASATTVYDLFLERRGLKSWWMYILCPAVSLVLGSYGLPPSLLRNLSLVVLGEIAGFIISTFPSLSFDIIRWPIPILSGSFSRPLHTTEVNTTVSNTTY